MMKIEKILKSGNDLTVGDTRVALEVSIGS
jgi:hypothetical protein